MTRFLAGELVPRGVHEGLVLGARNRTDAQLEPVDEAAEDDLLAGEHPRQHPGLRVAGARDGYFSDDEAGAVAKVSSIHVNGWYGAYDKLGMTRRLLADVFGIDIERDNARVLFAGDSPNDAPMFGFFRNSVAVANFRDFAARTEAHPRWITAAAGGAGFAEIADALLAARGAP